MINQIWGGTAREGEMEMVLFPSSFWVNCGCQREVFYIWMLWICKTYMFLSYITMVKVHG